MKKRNAFHWILVIFLVSNLFNGFTAGQEFILYSRPALDSYFNDIMKAQNYIGLGGSLIKGNKVIWQGCYGYADLDEKKEVRVNDIFQLASLSKVVTATALMQLYEKNFFKLDDDINKYLSFSVKNPNFPDKPITFRMLLTHTAGFADVLPAGNKISLGVWGDSEIPLETFVKELFTPGGKYYSTDYFDTLQPGTRYEYSNIAFSLVGYLVEKITGEDFSEYCKINIFQPLEMKNTGWHLRDLDTNRIVFGYGFPPADSVAAYKKVRHFGLPGYPEGMLRTTLQDFSNFIMTYLNNGKYKDFQMLKPETIEIMLAPQGVKNILSRSFPVTDMGLTWKIFNVEGEEYYSMNGFSGSIFTNALFSLKHKCGVIYYFTGISMKNMQASNDITIRLLKELND